MMGIPSHQESSMFVDQFIHCYSSCVKKGVMDLFFFSASHPCLARAKPFCRTLDECSLEQRP